MLELAKGSDCPLSLSIFGRHLGELSETYKQTPALLKEFAPKRPDVFIVDFYDKQATADVLTELLLSAGEGTSELMCHVGFVPDAFMKNPSTTSLVNVVGIMLDPAVRTLIDKLGIELINFSNL